MAVFFFYILNAYKYNWHQSINNLSRKRLFIDVSFSTKVSNKLLTKLIKLFFFLKLYMKIMKTFSKWRLVKIIYGKKSMRFRLQNNSSFLGEVNRLSFLEKTKFVDFVL